MDGADFQVYLGVHSTFLLKIYLLLVFFRIETSQSVPFCFNKTFDNFIVNREEIKL